MMSARFPLRRLLVVATILVLVALIQPRVRAHEIGTTRVAASFGADGTYRIEVVTDATTLLARLERAAGLARSDVTEPHAIQARITSLEGGLLRNLGIAFDGVRMDPVVRIAVDTPTELNGVPGATIELTGRRPDQARTFTWRYALTSAAYGLSVVQSDGTSSPAQWLEGNEESAAIPVGSAAPQPGRLRVLARYVAVGFTHILPGGLDHVLFVVGIFLLSRRVRPILLQVSAFTVAHSITLGLGMYGLVSVPGSVVEPLIALSIAFIAVENIIVRDVKSWRVGLVFVFGLLHGLGFAGALEEVGMPRSEFVTALLGFNIGVEMGQLAVIGVAWGLVGHTFGHRVWYRRRIVIPASVCIACFGVVWTLQRLHLV